MYITGCLSKMCNAGIVTGKIPPHSTSKLNLQVNHMMGSEAVYVDVKVYGLLRSYIIRCKITTLNVIIKSLNQS